MDLSQSPGLLQKYYGGDLSESPSLISERGGGAVGQYYSEDDGSQSPSVARARNFIGNTDYNGWCETFVEKTLGLPQMGASAADAWNNQLDKAVSGLSGVKAGDPIYFAPDASNEGYGHAAIYAGNGKMISATDNGVTEVPISEWQKETGQQLLGHIKL